MKTYFNLLILLPFLALSPVAYGAKKTFYSAPDKLETAQIQANGSLQVVDPDLYSFSLSDTTWRKDIYTLSQMGLVELKINNQNLNSAFQALDYTVTIKVHLVGRKFNSVSGLFETFDETKSLQVDFKQKGTYTSQAYIEIEGAIDITATVTECHSYPLNAIMDLELTAKIDIERYYLFDPSQTGATSSRIMTNTGESKDFEITWAVITNAEYYELEWTYIDNYRDGDLNETVQRNEIPLTETMFKNNSTRIITHDNQFRIPNIYGQGFLLYRVRAMGYGLWVQPAINGNPIEYHYTQAPIPGLWLGLNCHTSNCDLQETRLSDFIGQIAETGIEGYLLLNTRIFNDAEVAIENTSEDYIDTKRSFNYEYSTNFAEEGKYSTQLAFYDGSLKNRQTLSRAESKDNAKIVVSENIYDFQGRNAIQTLPVPLNSNQLEFTPELNKGIDGGGGIANYTPNLFDLDQSNCSIAGIPMDPSTGSSNYYSTNIDPELKLEQENADYIPIAANFPFVQIRYMPDNTGRVASQSQPGATFKLGSGKETKYFYDVPDQRDLDRLFGNEAGEASHFKMNMVRDPNGQHSVSIINLEGKTIATGLLGTNPETLIELDSKCSTEYSKDLLNKSFFNPFGSKNNDDLFRMGKYLNRPLYISRENSYEFGYGYGGQKYTSDCPPTTQTCYDCIMDLKISLKDECGNEYLYGYGNIANKTPIIIGESLLTQLRENINSVNCSTSAEPLNYKLGLNVYTDKVTDGTFKTRNASLTPVNLIEGNYSLSKSLEVNQEALELYTQKFLASTCFKPLSQFEAEAIAGLDLDGCEITCEQCSTQVNTFVSTHTDLTEGEIANLYEKCIEFCGTPVNFCNTIKEAMLIDMEPMGQYGQITKGGVMLSDNTFKDFENDPIDPSVSKVSVFNVANLLPRNPRIAALNAASNAPVFNKAISMTSWAPNWRFPFNESATTNTEMSFSYLDQNGAIDYVFITRIGNDFYPAVAEAYVSEIIEVDEKTFKVKPNYLANIGDYISLFKPSWANSLLAYHPEYEYSRLCEYLNASYDYDAQMEQITTFDDAKISANGIDQFMNPLGTNFSSADAQDPFFNTSSYSGAPTGFAITSILYDKMLDLMANFAFDPITNSPISMAEAAFLLVNCPDGQNTNCVNCTFILGTDEFSKISNTEDKTWIAYRSMYLATKRRLVEYLIHNFAINNGYYNGCVGKENFNSIENNFLSTYYNNPNSGSNTWYNSQFFNPVQPCNCSDYSLYKEKTARFVTQKDKSELGSVLDKFCQDANGLPTNCATQFAALKEELHRKNSQVGLTNCGQCPDAFGFENLFNALIKNQEFNTNSTEINLVCYNGLESNGVNGYAEMTYDMTKKLFPNITSQNYTLKYKSEYNNTTHKLRATFNLNDGEEECNIEFSFPEYYANLDMYDFNDIESMCCLRGIQILNEDRTLTGPFAIEATVQVKVKESDITNVSGVTPFYDEWVPETQKNLTLTGTTPCLSIAVCSPNLQCQPTNDVRYLLNFFNNMHRAEILFPSSGNLHIGNLLNKGTTISPYHGFFANSDFFSFFSNEFLFNQYGYRDPQTQNFNHFDWITNITSTNDECEFVLTNKSDPAFAGKPDFSCSMVMSILADDINSYYLQNIISFLDMEYEGDELYVNVIAEYPANTYLFKKVKLTSSCLTLGVCGDKVRNFNRISKISAGGNGGAPPPGPAAECEECRLNKRHLNPFMDWFNLLLHQNNKAEPYDSFYTLDNEYRWSSYNGVPIEEHPLNMPISKDNSSLCGSNVLTNLFNIYDPLTGVSNPVPNCPGQDFDCVITLYTIPAKFIKDVVNILSISRPPGTPYSYFEMIGENIMGEKVTIYGNSPCMDICEMNCGGGSGDCGFLQAIGFNGIDDGYETEFIHELDINNNNDLSDDLPTISNNPPTIENEYCLYDNSSFIFRMMGNQTTYKKLWKFGNGTGSGKSLKSNSKYKATFSIYYSNDANQPELEVFMRINGTIFSANRQKTVGLLSSNDYKVTYTYYFKTPFGGGNGTSITIPLEIYVLNSTNYFDPPNGDGSKDYLLYEIGVEESCEPDIPCCIVPQPELEIESPCSSMVYIAKANARELYNAYLNRTREGFKAAYIKKCLSAYEGFYMKQIDEKYHYTLYYYDQAGNLVRTIPPSGFTPLSNSEISQVELDRAAGTRTIFTNHDLATTYKYNSLNQLVEQTVPDNRDMDLIIQQNLSNGIPSGLTIRGIQGISESRSYLFADDNTANNYSRIFSTQDGGKSWQEHSDIGIRQLNKVQVVNASIQYAIGEEGLFLKSDNGGVDWQIKFIPSSSRLGQLYFIEPDKGMVFEESGMFYRTVDGGNTWTGPYNFLQKQFAPGSKLNSISCHYNQMYAISHLGEIFFSNNWGVIWEKQSKIRTKSAFTCASFLNNNSGFVAGENGLLLKGYLNTQTQWQAINTGINDHFVKIKFFTETFGVAIVKYYNSSVAYTKLQYTSNGGNSWSNAVVPSPYGSSQRFVDIGFINASTGFALTETGVILKTTDAGANWTFLISYTLFTYPSPPVLASSLGLIEASSNLFAFMGASNGDIFKADLNASSITWISFLGSSKPAISSDVTQIHAMTGTRIIYTLATGNAFTYTESSSSGVANLNSISGYYRIMGLNFAPGDANGFLLVQNTYPDYDYFAAKYTDAETIPLTVATSPIGQTETGDAAFLCINTQINEVAMVGFSSGELFAKELDNCITPTVCNWANVGERILAGSLADIDYYKDSSIVSSSVLVSSRAVATGANGKVLIKNLSLPYWTLLPFVCKTDYSQAKIGPSVLKVDPPVDLIALVGSGNYFGKISIDRLGDYSPTNSNYSNVSNYITMAAENYVLNDLQFWINQGSQPYFMACGKNTSTNKRAVLTGQITSGFNFTEENIPSTSVPDYAIAFKSIGIWNSSISSEVNYTVVGEEGKRVQKLETVFSEQIARPNRVNATQMINKDLGYAVGNGGKIYRTTDGAKTWQLLPGNTGITDNLSSVHFITSQLGFITGSSGLYKTTNGLDFILVSGYSFGALRDVHFNSGFGMLAGEGGILYYSLNLGSTWTQVTNSQTAHLNAIYVTGANPNLAGGQPLAFAVGDAGTILGIFKNGASYDAINQTYSGGSWISANYSSNYSLSDVYFSDFNTGYIIGAGGVCMKTTNGAAAITNNSQWTKIILNSTSSDFKTLFAQNSNQLLFAGSNGVVKKVNDRSDQLSSRFFYDAVGRLVVSQNAKQYYEATTGWNTYSYTLYDAHGRISEVGQISSQNPVEDLYAGVMMNATLFNSWVTSTSNVRTQVTKTFYDEMYFTTTPLGIPPYLRNRVSSTAYYESYAGDIYSYQSAIHYSYDIHGNVNRLLNDNPSLEGVGARYKEMEYVYDILTGKVIQVNYQKGEADQFSHHYEYDNLNRLTGVYTSNLTSTFSGEQYHSLWQKDARYSYYLHGPLARTELGNDKVQGVDYAYTIQGWLKGVNSATLVASRDMGKDGCQDCGTQPNSNFAPDEMGFVLGYYENDYQQVSTISLNNRFEISLHDPSNVAGELSTIRKNLFNGNISYMSTAIGKFMEGLDPLPNTLVYTYDQLNRIKNTKRFTNLNRYENFWTTTTQTNTDYNENFSFDANGNILTLQRNGTVQGSSNAMDNFSYSYEGFDHNNKKKTNKLLSVADNVSSYSLAGYEDLKPGQSYSGTTLTGNNYSYDAIGNLKSDEQEEIENITWNVYGKISEIIRNTSSLKPNLAFLYNSAGQRVCKIVKPAGSSQGDWEYSYNILDAQGNTMSTYKLKGSEINQDRIYLYGSSRIGELVPNVETNGLCGLEISDDDLLNDRDAIIETYLRNVFGRSTDPSFVSQAIAFWTNNWNTYFNTDAPSFSLEVNNMGTHQFMWNSWKDWICKLRCFETLDESVLTLWDTEWQTRLEPFLLHQINCSIETCPESYQNLLPLWHTSEQSMQTSLENTGFVNQCSGQAERYVKGSRHYELSNHLGNVLTVVSDRKIEIDESYSFQNAGGYKYSNGTYIADVAGDFNQLSAADGIISSYVAEVISATDYYAFGAPMPERSWQGSAYRFGFNGQEKDNEVSGAGNTMTAEFWEYDARLGRRWNLDPKPHIGISDYSCFGNNPVINIDPNGDYFFGFFGSTSEQRRAANDFAEATGGEVHKSWSKNINVTYKPLLKVCDEEYGVEIAVIKPMQTMHFTHGGELDYDGDGEVDLMQKFQYQASLKIGDYDIYTGYSKGSGALEAPTIDPIDVLAGLGGGALRGGALRSTARKSLVQLNKEAGDGFRDELAKALQNEGRDVAKEVYKKTPFGGRRIDIEVSKDGKVLGGIETKLGKSPYKPSQRAKDFWLKKVEGYQVDVVREPSRTGKK